MKLCESETVELKASYPPDLKKIIVFANTKGGIIYLGVKHSGITFTIYIIIDHIFCIN